jgi:deoxyadenosine/deoxycytidine kinase
MKKLKKLSKNKKPIVIFIYGPVAVGKLTVAKILSQKLGYKLAHNHHVNDFVEEVFDRHTYEANFMKEFLRYSILENMVKAKYNLVTTHCYWHNFVSKTGLTDPKYVKTLEKRLTKFGAIFYPVYLKATKKELLQRVTGSSRKSFRKLHTREKMKEYLSRLDIVTSPNLKNNLIIDNSKLRPTKVADMIIKHFKLK